MRTENLEYSNLIGSYILLTGKCWRKIYHDLPFHWNISHNSLWNNSKVSPLQGLMWPRVIALLFHDRGTRGGKWSASRPGRSLPPAKNRYPLCRRLGGSQGRPGRRKSRYTGIRSTRIVQPVVSPYTDWATWLTLYKIKIRYSQTHS